MYRVLRRSLFALTSGAVATILIYGRVTGWSDFCPFDLVFPLAMIVITAFLASTLGSLIFERWCEREDKFLHARFLLMPAIIALPLSAFIFRLLGWGAVMISLIHLILVYAYGAYDTRRWPVIDRKSDGRAR